MTGTGFLNAEWRTSDAGRRARYYVLTSKGRRRLEADEARYEAIAAAVTKLLKAT
jgi:PadR family transcriptional regulator PadR